MYCIIAVWRRIRSLRFRTAAEQEQFLETMDQLLKNQDFDSMQQMCEADQRALPKLAAVAAQNPRLGEEPLKQLLGEIAHRDVLAPLEYQLGWIATTVKSGPLLGLFGTVLGMMAAFGRIGTGEKVQPSQIAGEISVALICTAMGLATAIPFTYVLSGLSVRVRMLQESLGYGLTRLVGIFSKSAMYAAQKRTAV
jgi:biopolymer transport protein ExbB/TolQ